MMQGLIANQIKILKSSTTLYRVISTSNCWLLIRREQMVFDDQYGVSHSGSASFMHKVYAWMSAGLAATAIIAHFAASWYPLMQFVMKPGVLLGLFICQIVLVIAISAAIRSLSFPVALALFFLYAGLLGLTLSTIFLLYTQASIYATFIVSSGMFGAMALYGALTKADLTSVGNYAIMALWGIILSVIVNMFLRSQQFDFIISLVGVAVFVLLTAADSQKIKRLATGLYADKETADKVTVLCALTLYLDFINLFLFLLRFLGRPKE